MLEKRPGVFLIGQNAHKGHRGCHNGVEPQGREMVDQAVQTEAATTCYRCGEVGHVAQNCKRRKGKSPHRQVEW
jgi:hypothetical protein